MDQQWFEKVLSDFQRRFDRIKSEYKSEDITYYQALDELDELVDDLNDYLTLKNFLKMTPQQFSQFDKFNTMLLTWRFN